MNGPLTDYSNGSLLPNRDDPLTVFRLHPDLEGCAESLFDHAAPSCTDLSDSSGKIMYRILVKTLNSSKLSARSDALHKPPLTKKHVDLQWRIRHGVGAVNAFVCHKRPCGSYVCVLCSEEDVFL